MDCVGVVIAGGEGGADAGIHTSGEAYYGFLAGREHLSFMVTREGEKMVRSQERLIGNL